MKFEDWVIEYFGDKIDRPLYSALRFAWNSGMLYGIDECSSLCKSYPYDTGAYLSILIKEKLPTNVGEK